jgi:general secretion pathway protein G
MLQPNSLLAPGAVRGSGSALRRTRGFTLIEIMVVVIIIGLLAAVIVPQFMGRVDDARITKARSDLQAIETALTMYRLDNFRYPTTEQGLTALVTRPNDPSVRNWRPEGYLKGAKKDPWGNEYQYQFPGTRGADYDLFSLGADAQEGGEGVNADVGNWNQE